MPAYVEATHGTRFCLYEDRKHASISSGSSCLINYERRTTFALIALIITIRGITPSPPGGSVPSPHKRAHLSVVYLKYDTESLCVEFRNLLLPAAVNCAADIPFLWRMLATV